MAEVIKLKRVFLVNHNNKNIEIDDPNPDMTITEVQKFLSGLYPSITNATKAEPEVKNEVITYKFTTNFSDKG